MKVTIEVTKRTAWRLHRTWRRILRMIPGTLELVGYTLVIGGFFAVIGEMGNFECGELMRVSVMVGGATAATVGHGLLWVVREIDEALAEDIRRKQKRIERYRR